MELSHIHCTPLRRSTSHQLNITPPRTTRSQPKWFYSTAHITQQPRRPTIIINHHQPNYYNFVLRPTYRIVFFFLLIPCFNRNSK
mmetsp:Transcript_12036/g.26231  ORF Transcript_12036/g.26231 Transcript_12036/m.26231 type:complete len:85 (-) Transcript_12036:18-272(-)